jgi:hypothetical protein
MNDAAFTISLDRIVFEFDPAAIDESVKTVVVSTKLDLSWASC